MHEFPGRRAFEWALILPLAMPAYVIAFVYTDLLQFVGPVQTVAARTDRLVEGRLLVPRRALARGRDGDVHLRPVSLCVPARAGGIPGALGEPARSGTHAGSGQHCGVFPRGVASRASGRRGRHGARADGDDRRFRDGVLLRGADFHHRHLSGVVLDGRARGRRAARGGAARFRGARAAARAREPRPQALPRNLAAHARPVAPAPRGIAGRRRYRGVRDPLCARVPVAGRAAAADGGRRRRCPARSAVSAAGGEQRDARRAHLRAAGGAGAADGLQRPPAPGRVQRQSESRGRPGLRGPGTGDRGGHADTARAARQRARCVDEDELRDLDRDCC